MEPTIIKFKKKDGEITEGLKHSEDSTGYWVWVKGRKTPKHIKFSQVLGEND